MNQFLILHKVRGEPAFDIAEQCKIGDEEGWILCTCGHRAYPFKFWPLGSVGVTDAYDIRDLGNTLPKDWPEHYTQHPEPKLKINVLEVVSSMLPKLKRRI